MSVTEPLRREHQDLRPRVADLDTIADRLDDWNAGTPDDLRTIVEFLRDHLVPHARAEEAELYPMVEQVMRAPGATSTMVADHVEIVRRIDELAETVGAVGTGPASTAEATRLRSQLYGLSAVLRLHFDKEEEVLLPVLDAHMNVDEATQLFARMSAVAHPHQGTAHPPTSEVEGAV